MKIYLNEFTTESDYISAKANRSTFYRPAISLIEEGHDLKYDPLFFFNPRYLYSDLSTSKNLNSEKTVIGVEVIPASHETDGKARFVSVRNMSRAAGEVETGSVATGNVDTNSAAMIPWGRRDDDIPGMTNYSNAGYKLAADQEAVTEANPYGFINELDSSETTNILVSDYDNGCDGNDYPFFDGAFLPLNNTTSPVIGNKPLPYPFNADGTKNLLYWNNGVDTEDSSNTVPMVIADMDGAGNTTTLIGRINVEGWQSGELNTTVENLGEGIYNHPAAAACYRFNPASSNTAHQWYLPSAGELGYLWANIAKINAKIDALPLGQGVKLGILSDSSASVGSLGKWLWSSSEYNDDIAWYLNLSHGYWNGYNKVGAYGDGRVRAFFSLQ